MKFIIGCLFLAMLVAALVAGSWYVGNSKTVEQHAGWTWDDRIRSD